MTVERVASRAPGPHFLLLAELAYLGAHCVLRARPGHPQERSPPRGEAWACREDRPHLRPVCACLVSSEGSHCARSRRPKQTLCNPREWDNGEKYGQWGTIGDKYG